VRWYIKPPFNGILLNNIYTKNYWSPTFIVEIMVAGWVVSFFETQCIFDVGDKKVKFR